MNRDLAKLIEDIRTANEQTLRTILDIFAIEDPVERFSTLEALNEPALAWALPRAKAVTIAEIRNRPDKPSLRAVGVLLGISAQRVHQLANPEPRRSSEWNPKK
jgi:hypothetical protein